MFFVRLLTLLALGAALVWAASTVSAPPGGEGDKSEAKVKEYEVKKTDAEWRAELTDQEFRILRQKGTEYAGTGKYNKFSKKGTYVCAGCGHELFSSKHKYNSGSGWPSYWKPIDDKALVTESDTSYGMVRTEVLCARCGGHLGHVFNDGPRPTGQRYCINSISMDFVDKEGNKDENSH